MNEDGTANKDFNQSVEKCLKVLTAFSEENPFLTLAEVARLTGVNRAAARRIVLTLHELGYIGTRGRNYFLLPKVLELGYAYLSSSALSGVAQSHLDILAGDVGEAASVGVLDGEQYVVYVARATGSRIMTANARVGSRLDAVTTSIGRVLLAGLDDAALDAALQSHTFQRPTEHSLASEAEVRTAILECRNQGWCAVDQEQEIGIRSIAAPIRNEAGQTIAAVNISAHASRIPLEELVNDTLPRLQSVASDIARDLKYLAAQQLY